MAHDVRAERDRGRGGSDRAFQLAHAGSSPQRASARGEIVKAVHISVVALIGAVSGIAMAVATKNSEALASSILALVTAFLPAVQLVLPWFQAAEKS
jgi:hypothetical protein